MFNFLKVSQQISSKPSQQIEENTYSVVLMRIGDNTDAVMKLIYDKYGINTVKEGMVFHDNICYAIAEADKKELDSIGALVAISDTSVISVPEDMLKETTKDDGTTNYRVIIKRRKEANPLLSLTLFDLYKRVYPVDSKRASVRAATVANTPNTVVVDKVSYKEARKMKDKLESAGAEVIVAYC